MIIKGENIHLQAIEPSEYDGLTKILAHPQVKPYLFGYPAELEGMAFDKWLAKSRENEQVYYFSVKQAQDAQTIGICAYQEIDYKNGSVAVWAAIDPAFAQKGHGAQTLKLLAQNAFDQLRMEHVAFYCLEGDSAAISWAQRAGFTRDAVLYSRIKKADKRMSLELYSLLKEEGE